MFQSSPRPHKLFQNIWQDFTRGKQTIGQLCIKYSRSPHWIVNALQKASISKIKHTPCEIILILDATYWKRGNGILVARASNLKKILAIKSITHETTFDYWDLFLEIKLFGYDVIGVVTDGKRGVRDLFHFLPYQFCQFHQVAIVGRLLTKKPKLIASIEFKLIMNKLTNSTQLDFEQEITNWYTKWETFLGERTYSNDGKHYTRTHKNIWSAYRSVKFNLPYLFTYQKYPSLKIPNTSNALDGYFSHLKDKLRNHRGLRNTMRMKIVNELIIY